MAKSEKIKIKVSICLSMWDAIKLRIAGKRIEKLLREEIRNASKKN
jgi:hypothetical protein